MLCRVSPGATICTDDPAASALRGGRWEGAGHLTAASRLVRTRAAAAGGDAVAIDTRQRAAFDATAGRWSGAYDIAARAIAVKVGKAACVGTTGRAQAHQRDCQH